ncbi:MAG: FAD-dependent oxidoreductase, partial [Gemmatimonadales bacterium]
NGTVSSLSLVRARNGKPTEHELDEIPADLVVIAIGQARLMELVNTFQGVECDGRGHIIAGEATGVTGNPRVFAGGDACNGGKEVVNAVAEGQRAATAIDAMLMGSDSGGKNA